MNAGKKEKRIAAALFTSALATGIAACDVSDIIQPIPRMPKIT